MHAIKIAQFDGHAGAIYSLEHGVEDHLFFSGSDDNLLVEWNLFDNEKNQAVVKLPVKAYALAYVEDQNTLLIGNYTGGIHVVDLKLKQEMKLIQLHQHTIFDLKYIPQKNCAIVLCYDGTFSVWSMKDYSCIKVVKLSDYKLRSIDYSNNRNEAAIGCGDGTIRIIELDNFNEVKILRGHMDEYSVNTVKYHPDGKRLVSGSRDGHLIFWDLQDDFKVIEQIPAHSYAIYSVVFNPAGNYFASGSMDKSIKIWSAQSNEMLLKIAKPSYDAHTSSVNKLLWSKYNDYLVSTGDDRTIKAWKILEE